MAGIFDSYNSYAVQFSFEAGEERANASDEPVSHLQGRARARAGALLAWARATPWDAQPVLAGLYLAAYGAHTCAFDDPARAALLDWLRKELKPLSPDLARVALIDMQIYNLKLLTPNERREMREAFVTFVTDRGIAPGLRYGALRCILPRSDMNLLIDDAECCRAMAELVVAAIGEGTFVGSVDFLKRFKQLKAVSPADVAMVMAALKAFPPNDD